MKKNVGKNLKILRKKRGCTQEDVADYLKISQSTYARIENGISNSWSIYLEAICAFYEIKPKRLLKKNKF